MKVMDLSGGHTFVKALIYGKSGMGKTTFACTAPRPLFLLSERQGIFHIKSAINRLGLTGDDVPIVMFMETADDYIAVGRVLAMATRDPSLKNGPFRVTNRDGEEMFRSPLWPQTIVFDSFTDACALIEADINAIAPPRPGKDGLPVPSERFWGALKDRVQKLIRLFRDIDFHLIFLCLENDKTIGKGDEAIRVVNPQLPMQDLPQWIAASVNVVGIMRRQIKGSEDEEAEIKWAVRTVGPSFYLLKPYRPLADVERPDFTYWLKKIAGTLTPSDEKLSDEKLAQVATMEAAPVEP